MYGRKYGTLPLRTVNLALCCNLKVILMELEQFTLVEKHLSKLMAWHVTWKLGLGILTTCYFLIQFDLSSTVENNHCQSHCGIEVKEKYEILKSIFQNVQNSMGNNFVSWWEMP